MSHGFGSQMCGNDLISRMIFICQLVRVNPTVMENPGKNCCHGKSWKSLGIWKFPKKSWKSPETASSHGCGSFRLWLSCMLWDTIITISETMWEWESWKKANQSWKSHGILFSDFCENPGLVSSRACRPHCLLVLMQPYGSSMVGSCSEWHDDVHQWRPGLPW